MVIFGVIGTKGGVGKTTLSANIGALIADMGLRVLLVDADIQASLSKSVINRADRTNDAKLVMAEIRQGYLDFGGNVRVANAVIPSAVIYKEAATYRTPVHRMRSVQAFETMHQLVWELLPNLEGVYAGATTDGIESNE